jgi:prepilin-type processing-associated H-X9-DG protein
MANNRSLVTAWRLYVDDNQGSLPFASERSGESTNDANCWVYGAKDFNPDNRSNWDPECSLKPGVLWPYARSTTIYKCPADPSTIIVTGVPKPFVRTMAMNLWVGGLYPDENAIYNAGYPATVPLTNWTVYRKQWQINAASNGGAAGIFVFQDERPDYIDAPKYGTCMDGYPVPGVSAGGDSMYRFWDMPGIMHAGGCNFSYADGHTEYHKWTDARTLRPLRLDVIWWDNNFSPGNMDVNWIQARATRPKN